jgi:glutaminyl-peptide cyclotransferase
MLNSKTLLFILGCCLYGCGYSDENPQANFEIKASINLPKDCFVQGFIKQANAFYLSCGRYKQSQLLKLSNQGDVLYRHKLPDDFFAEGIAIAEEQLLLLSWKNQQALSFNTQQLQALQSYSYTGEGWGLELYNSHWLKSDGSAQLQLLDKKNLHSLERFSMRDKDGNALPKINELENIAGFIAANIWHSSDVVFFQKPLAANNRVAFSLRLDSLAKMHKRQGVLNGLAYDAQGDCLWVTGKLWGKAYALSIDTPALTLACNL